MKRFHRISLLLLISCRWSKNWGTSGVEIEIASNVLKKSLRQLQSTHDFIPLGHLAAELREVDESLVGSINLDYHDHPYERILNSIDNVFVPTNISSILKKPSVTADPTNVPSISPSSKGTNPIRITFETSEIEKRAQSDERHAGNVEKIINSTLPKVSEIWSSILSVTPVEGNIIVNQGDCYGFIDFPSNVMEEGISDTDLLIFVTAHDTINNITLCGGNALASASYCSMDQHDRPVVGFMNFCVENVDAEDNEDAVVAIGVHELTHILGFSDDLFKYFRDNHGQPLTKRPFQKSSVKCVDGTIRQKMLASTSTLQSRENDDGSVYFEIVSPTVVDILRNHFNCEKITGARLENQPTRRSCTGSHWDERFFFTDIMSPIFSSDSVSLLSPLTVAFIKDTGWYEVSFASRHIKNNPFGLGAGCDFLVEDNCIKDNKVPDQYEEYFCHSVTKFTNDGYPTRGSQTTCDPSFSHIAYCSLVDFSSGEIQVLDYTSRQNTYSDLSILGSYLQNTYTARQVNASRFDNPNIGSIFLQSDDCPIASIFSIDCTDPTTNLNHKLYPEEDYGVNSRCFNSLFEHPVHGGIPRAVCLQSFCNKEIGILEVFIGGETIICNYDGERHQFPLTDDVYFICPPLLSICPMMACPSMCSGQGICNHELDPPQCECFDENDFSPGCYGVGVEYEYLDYGYEFDYPGPPLNNIGFGDDNASTKIGWRHLFLVKLAVWGAALAIVII